MNEDHYKDEQELIRGLKNGSHRAFDSIYHLYAKRLYAYCLSYTKSREEAEEIVQDVFVKLWMNRTAIRQDETLRSLFFIMAKHQLINAYRKRLNHPTYEEFLTCRELPDSTDVYHQLEYEEFVGRFKAALRKLPPTQQRVIGLSRIDGLPNREIAARLALSEQTVKNQLSLGLKSLREALGSKEFLAAMLFIINECL